MTSEIIHIDATLIRADVGRDNIAKHYVEMALVQDADLLKAYDARSKISKRRARNSIYLRNPYVSRCLVM